MLPHVTARETEPDAVPVSPDQILEQLKKLLVSRPLRESHQLQAFLEFIVHETLDGRADGLKEYLLGCRVFGRRPDYDPRIDGIVRVQATMLRKRLEKYYATEGVSDSVVIDLPRGGYVPSFRLNLPDAPQIPAASGPVAPPAVQNKRSWLIAFVLGCLLTSAASILIGRIDRPFMVTTATAADCPQIWGPFFAPGANNLIAYGVPLFFSSDGLYVRDVGVNAVGEGDQSRIRRVSTLFDRALQPMDDLYTGVGELESTYRLTNFFATRGVPVRVMNARTLGASDLAGHNLVAVSSLRFQTLLREQHLPEVFRFQSNVPESILDLKAQANGEKLYVYRQGAGVSTSYAVVSVWPGATPGTRIMHVGGVHTWATQAAVEFLLQPERLRQIAGEFNKDRTTGARGPVSPYFQLLLRVEGRGNQSHRVEYVTHHYLLTDPK